MRRCGFLLVLVGLWAAPGSDLRKPDDLDFRIRFVRDKVSYHAGESIDVEILFSTQAEKKYAGSWTSPRPEFETEALQISPMDGVVDLRDRIRGWSGSIVGSYGYLGTEPQIEHLDLSDWYRFQKPGHYSLAITSKSVSRVKSAEEGGGQEHLTLESNPLEFDILPADPSWDAAELAEIERVVDHSEDPQELYPALHRLEILDTPASVQKLVQLYLSRGPDGDPSHSVAPGLNNSLRADLVIELLESSLSDPKRNPRGLGADLLAEFQVRKEMGALPHRPDDPEKVREWERKVEERNKSYEKYFARNNALLLTNLEQRSGPERTVAIYEAWKNAERQNGQNQAVPENLSRLRSDVLAVALKLGPGERVQILYSMWPTQPHAQLKPIVLSLMESRRKEDNFYLDEAYKFWCEEWPQECSTAILADAIHPGTPTSKNAVFLLGEAEHPELDEILRTRLKSPEMLQDSWESQRTAAIILRGGSRELRPSVDEFLDKYVAQPRYGCEIDGYLIGYLFRIAPADATKRFAEETQSEDKPCGTELLRTLHQVRYTDDLIAVALKALDSPNLGAAGTAALFLGIHGKASAKENLWKRIEMLREEWRERAAELREAETTILGEGKREQTGQLKRARTAYLEQALVSALVRGTNWKLTPGEQQDLREGCFTDKCREIAEGRMSFGF